MSISTIPKDEGTKPPIIAAIDQAGRLNLVGSVVVAGISFEPDKVKELKELNLNNVTEEQLPEMFMEVVGRAWHFHILYIKPEWISQSTQQYNMYHMEAQAITKIAWIVKVPESWKRRTTFKLNDYEPNARLFERIKAVPMPENLFDEKKYEWIVENGAHLKHATVAAANVLARYHLQVENNILKAMHGDFGSGRLDDPNTIKWVKENMDNELIRTNWKKYHEIKKEIEDAKKEE